MISPLIKKLIDALCGLQGVGPKSAQRMCFQLLGDTARLKGKALAQALTDAMRDVKECARCRTYTEDTHCTLCTNPKRKQTQLCVVESPADVMALEQTHVYQGLYFVLHGHLSPLDGIGPGDVGIDQLLHTLQNGGIEEIILATNSTMEGEATAHYIASQLSALPIKCTRIAHGVPMGGELEYLDGNTLTRAFQSRAHITEGE